MDGFRLGHLGVIAASLSAVRHDTFDSAALWLYIAGNTLVCAAFFATLFVLLVVLPRREDLMSRHVCVLLCLSVLFASLSRMADMLSFWLQISDVRVGLHWGTAFFAWAFAVGLYKTRRRIRGLPSASELANAVRQRSLAEKRAQSILSAATNAIVVCDARGIITCVNPAAEKTFFTSAGELVGKAVVAIIPERFRGRHRRDLRRMVGGDGTRLPGQVTELIGLRADGTEFRADVSLSQWEEAGTSHFVAVFNDTTERALAEARAADLMAQLNVQAERYRLLECEVQAMHEFQVTTDNHLAKTAVATVRLEMIAERLERVVLPLGSSVDADEPV